MAEEKVEELSLSSIMPNDQRMVSKWKKHEEYSKKISRENLREDPDINIRLVNNNNNLKEQYGIFEKNRLLG